MAREYRVQTALRQTEVPVPRTFSLSDAEGPLGVPFYVMERLVGHVCWSELPPGYAEAPSEREAIGRALIETLAILHSVDPERVGLGDLGHAAGFMERQLRRWSKQWQYSKAEELPLLDSLRDRLRATLPTQRASSIVHGDFRLDNAILHPTGAGDIIAVLDWEMSTLGDPLSDLGALLAYWCDEEDDEVLLAARILPPLTALEGFPTRDAMVESYARMTGFDVADLGWYRAFAYFKLAVVFQGIAARATRGAMLTEGLGEALQMVEPLVRAGDHVLAMSAGNRT